MKCKWCYELPPLEERTSLFWLYPKVMPSLNSVRLQKHVIFNFQKSDAHHWNSHTNTSKWCHHCLDEACSISTFQTVKNVQVVYALYPHSMLEACLTDRSLGCLFCLLLCSVIFHSIKTPTSTMSCFSLFFHHIQVEWFSGEWFKWIILKKVRLIM